MYNVNDRQNLNSFPAANNKKGFLSPGNINILKANLLHQASLIRYISFVRLQEWFFLDRKVQLF